MRHGLTVGELAHLFRAERGIDVELEVVACEGWRRGARFRETGLPWVLPSPNMPTPETALVYPGTCLLEGTNLSEGRGTTKPFELVGAPWLDGARLAGELAAERLPGVAFRPASFVPTWDKHAGARCHGVELVVTDAERFRPCRTGLAVVLHARRQEPARLRAGGPRPTSSWRACPPSTSSRARRGSASRSRQVRRCSDLVAPLSGEERAFARRRGHYLRYDP